MAPLGTYSGYNGFFPLSHFPGMGRTEVLHNWTSEAGVWFYQTSSLISLTSRRGQNIAEHSTNLVGLYQVASIQQ